MKASELKVELNMDSVVKRMRAISKHTEALANELEKIDDEYNKYDCLLCNKGTSKVIIKNCCGDEKKICVWCYDAVRKSMA